MEDKCITTRCYQRCLGTSHSSSSRLIRTTSKCITLEYGIGEKRCHARCQIVEFLMHAREKHSTSALSLPILVLTKYSQILKLLRMVVSQVCLHPNTLDTNCRTSDTETLEKAKRIIYDNYTLIIMTLLLQYFACSKITRHSFVSYLIMFMLKGST